MTPTDRKQIEAEALRRAAAWWLGVSGGGLFSSREVAAELERMAKELEGEPLGCAHGRAVGTPCPHCLGVNATHPVCTTCGGVGKITGYSRCPDCSTGGGE